MQSWNLKLLLKRFHSAIATFAQPNIVSTTVADPATGVSSISRGELSGHASDAEKPTGDDSKNAVYLVEGSQIVVPSYMVALPSAAGSASSLVQAGHVEKGVLSTASAGDANAFLITDVCLQDQPQSEKCEVVSMDAKPASLPVGLTWLNIDRRSNIRIDPLAELVTPDSVKIHLDTPADTVRHSAGCTLFTGYANDRNFQFGRFSTLNNHSSDKRQMQTSRKITFPKPFHEKPPKVIVWLSDFHMSNSANWRCKAYVTDIAADSFVIHIDTWASTTLYSATASWIAYSSDLPNVVSGSFNTMDVRPWFIPKKKNKGTATFHQMFESIPRVFAAVNWLDISNTTDLRLKLEISNVSTKGLHWHLDTWDSTVLYSAGASYIAILD